MEIQKYRNSSHKALPLLELTFITNKYCKSSVSSAEPVSKNR